MSRAGRQASSGIARQARTTALLRFTPTATSAPAARAACTKLTSKNTASARTHGRGRPAGRHSTADATRSPATGRGSWLPGEQFASQSDTGSAQGTKPARRPNVRTECSRRSELRAYRSAPLAPVIRPASTYRLTDLAPFGARSRLTVGVVARSAPSDPYGAGQSGWRRGQVQVAWLGSLDARWRSRSMASTRSIASSTLTSG